MPDDLMISGAEAAMLADQLLRRGGRSMRTRSSRRRGSPARRSERDLWQGLAQIAVGLTHARRGNARGAVALLRRGAQRVRAYQDQPADRHRPRPGPYHPYGMDIPAVLAAADDLAARIERHGLEASRPPT